MGVCKEFVDSVHAVMWNLMRQYNKENPETFFVIVHTVKQCSK